MWALLGIRSNAGVIVFALFYGFVSGAFLTLVSPSIAAFSTSPTMNDIGSVYVPRRVLSSYF
jgi:hypothetical protein